MKRFVGLGRKEGTQNLAFCEANHPPENFKSLAVQKLSPLGCLRKLRYICISEQSLATGDKLNFSSSPLLGGWVEAEKSPPSNLALVFPETAWYPEAS